MNNSYGQLYNTNYVPGYIQQNPYFGNPVPMGQQNANNSLRQQFLYGRLINSVDDVKPQEVPMDGSVGIFPTSDYSKIYAKCWDASGRILTEVYERQTKQEEPDNLTTNAIAAVMERLDKIEHMLSAIPEVNGDVQRTAVRTGSATKKSGSGE